MKRLSTDAIRLGARGAVTRISPLMLALALPLALAGCEKDEPPPPLPAAPAASAPAPQTELVLEEEALPEDDSKPEVKTGGTARPAASLRACCAALHQNAANAPPPNDGYLKTAASMCDGMVAAGQTAGAAATLQAALRGAGLPSACR
jgi:hypothetical protein